MAYHFALDANAAPTPGPFGRLIHAIVRAWVVGRDTRRLMEMPDYRLRDLGLTHSDIARVVRHGRD